ncbi:MAG: hypothetical protein R2682_01850 [Pyrinomonadaceae bacterium]
MMIMKTNDDIAREEADRVMYALGGINVANRVAAALDTEAMRSLIRIEEDKLYRSLGFETFVDFLNSDLSPVSKSQFYERKALLDKEGDALFNLLTEAGVPLRSRKLLGRGSVEVADDALIIHADGETQEIAVDNRRAMLDALSALADANAVKAAKLERQADTIAQHDAKVAGLEAEIKRVRASKAAEFVADRHMTVRVEAGVALNKLAKIAADLSDIEKDQLRDSVLEDLASHLQTLRAAYRTETHTAEPEIVGDTFGEALDNFLANVDLDAAGNDGELAAKL